MFEAFANTTKNTWTLWYYHNYGNTVKQIGKWKKEAVRGLKRKFSCSYFREKFANKFFAFREKSFRKVTKITKVFALTKISRKMAREAKRPWEIRIPRGKWSLEPIDPGNVQNQMRKTMWNYWIIRTNKSGFCFKTNDTSVLL
jgi:hypothetical protein